MLGVTFDGASVNRRLVKIHDSSSKLTFKVQNVYSEDGRDLFTFSDTPHLIKTTRNCWSAKCRSLWVYTVAVYNINVVNLKLLFIL